MKINDFTEAKMYLGPLQMSDITMITIAIGAIILIIGFNIGRRFRSNKITSKKYFIVFFSNILFHLFNFYLFLPCVERLKKLLRIKFSKKKKKEKMIFNKYIYKFSIN